ncbi:hypothetical protein, partial [Streptomyces sp. DSM 41634]|uniref:hypothetical protein n=1 Tax=Streptomyces sp. DSM 41634 TaxID=3448656 RepID=UPI0040403A87
MLWPRCTHAVTAVRLREAAERLVAVGELCGRRAPGPGSHTRLPPAADLRRPWEQPTVSDRLTLSGYAGGSHPGQAQ